MFFINVPIGLLVLAGTRTLTEAELHKGTLDIGGALTSVGGMTALIYAITRGAEHGWIDSLTLSSFLAAAVLLPVFVALQTRSKDPLVPLRLFKDRNRTGSYLGMLLLAIGPIGAFYLLTLYMQHILAYSPLVAGPAWLPFGLGIVLGAGVSSKLVLRLAPRGVAVPGMVLGSIRATLALGRQQGAELLRACHASNLRARFRIRHGRCLIDADGSSGRSGAGHWHRFSAAQRFAANRRRVRFSVRIR